MLLPKSMRSLFWTVTGQCEVFLFEARLLKVTNIFIPKRVREEESVKAAGILRFLLKLSIEEMLPSQVSHNNAL